MPKPPNKFSVGLAGAARDYQRGLAAFETGRYLEAIEALTAVAEGNNLPATLAGFYLAQAHVQQGIVDLNDQRYAAAAAHFTEARRINPDSRGLSGYLARCYAAQNRFDLVASEMQRSDASDASDGSANASRRDTTDPTRPIRLAHAFVRDGQLPRAMAVLQDAVEAAPHRADLRLHLALLHASIESFDEALALLERAAELAPLDADVQLHLALTLAAVGRTDEAVRHLSTAQRLRPYDAHVALLLTIAVQSRQDGRKAAARAPVRAVAAAAPSEESDSLEALGDVMTSEPEFVEAFLSLPESDVDPQVFAMLAATLERALERRPDYADLHYHCSRVYARLGRTDSAIEKAGRAVEINPRYVQALIQLGRLYAQTDRREEAIDRLKGAIDAGGDYPDVHCLLGDLHRRCGDAPRARQAYRKALELNANYSRAQEALAAVSG